jgi:hypothetical protein
MVLQNCMDFSKVEPGLSDETCPALSHDRTQVIDIKVEVSHTREVEDPLLITLPGIKAEHKVSCRFQRFLMMVYNTQNYCVFRPNRVGVSLLT